MPPSPSTYTPVFMLRLVRARLAQSQDAAWRGIKAREGPHPSGSTAADEIPSHEARRIPRRATRGDFDARLSRPSPLPSELQASRGQGVPGI